MYISCLDSVSDTFFILEIVIAELIINKIAKGEAPVAVG
jgi:hypothetical protein